MERLSLLVAVGVLALSVRGGGITRGQFAVALWESVGAVPFAVCDFADVPPQGDAAVAIGWAQAEGLMRGVGDGLFAPDRPITRQEAAVALRRCGRAWGMDTFLPDGVAECNDYLDADPWAGDDLYWACGEGWLPWSEGGRLDPYGGFTDQELDSVLRFFVHGEKEA